MENWRNIITPEFSEVRIVRKEISMSIILSSDFIRK